MKRSRSKDEQAHAATMRAGVHYAPFLVDDEPYCVWDMQLAEHNRQSIRSIQPEYFNLQAAFLDHAPADTDNQVLATLARTFYVHALETTLAIVFAGMQAPQSVYAWLQKYRIEDIVSLAQKVEDGRSFRTRCTTPPRSWSHVAEFYLAHMPSTLTTSEGATVVKQDLLKPFSDTLENMAREFLEPETRMEYNAVKHGLRSMPGPLSIAFQPEISPGVPDASKAPTVIQGPATGASLLELVRDPKLKCNFRVAQRARNWDFEQAAQRLQLAALWLTCVKAGLRAHLGDVDPPPKWQWIADQATYSAPWRVIHGTFKINFGTPNTPIPDFATKEWILKLYNQRSRV